MKIACIGDSLSTGFSLGSVSSSIWLAHTRRNQGWFNGTDPGLHSLAARLRTLAEVQAISFARVSAHAIPPPETKLSHRLLGAQHLDAQVRQTLRESPLPDVVLIWIGHNDIDYIGCNHTDLAALAANIGEAVLAGADRVASALNSEGRRRLVIVFGLISFSYFFRARDEAELRQQHSPQSYPGLEMGYEVFPSMRAPVRHGMIRTAEMINAHLQAGIGRRRARGDTKVVYSDALATTDISRANCLAARDAWHPSAHGHDLLAASAFHALQQHLEWLLHLSSQHPR